MTAEERVRKFPNTAIVDLIRAAVYDAIMERDYEWREKLAPLEQRGRVSRLELGKVLAWSLGEEGG